MDKPTPPRMGIQSFIAAMAANFSSAYTNPGYPVPGRAPGRSRGRGRKERKLRYRPTVVVDARYANCNRGTRGGKPKPDSFGKGGIKRAR